MPLLHASVTREPLDSAALERLVADARSGAVTTFTGRIRDHDPEAAGEVTGIDYTHHPDADAMIGPIVEGVLADFDPDGDARVAAVHRVGRLDVGDLALVVSVATPHRRLGFDVAQAVVERIKAELPIWKQQFEADGRAVWSQLGLGEERP